MVAEKAQTVVNFKVVLNQDELSYDEVLWLPHPCHRGLVRAGLHHTQQQNVSYSKKDVSKADQYKTFWRNTTALR